MEMAIQIGEGFSIRKDLLERLKELAVQRHSDVNEVLEGLLEEAEPEVPNAETRAAIAEVKARHFAGGPLDISSVEAFLKSAGV